MARLCFGKVAFDDLLGLWFFLWLHQVIGTSSGIPCDCCCWQCGTLLRKSCSWWIAPVRCIVHNQVAALPFA
jgi:hypothetical protein